MKGTYEVEFTFAELMKLARYEILADYIRRENSRYVDRDKCMLILEPEPGKDDDPDWVKESL